MTLKKNTKKKKINYVYWLKIIGIPATISIIFINLYRNGNPKFDELISNIDFSFINFQWFLVAICGYYLLSNISKPVIVDPATTIDTQTDNDLKKQGETKEEDLKKEHQFGFILITALNILILLFLITDITYLLTSTDLRASSFSDLLK